MKKILFIVLLTLVSYNIQSQNDTISITQAERIIDKYSDKVVNGFETIIEKVTPTAVQGFEVAVRLQIAKGIVCLLPFILVIIFFILFIKSSSSKKDENIIFMYGMITLFTGIISSFTLYISITHLVAPEWYAIVDIIELVK